MEQHYCSVSTCFKNNPATPYLTVEACEDHMASQVETQTTPDANGQLPPVSELRVKFEENTRNKPQDAKIFDS